MNNQKVARLHAVLRGANNKKGLRREPPFPGESPSGTLPPFRAPPHFSSRLTALAGRAFSETSFPARTSSSVNRANMISPAPPRSWSHTA